MKKDWKFTQTVAIEKPANLYKLAEELELLGYRPHLTRGVSDVLFLSNGTYYASNFQPNTKYDFQILKKGEEELFLALASMTDKKDGIKGEWWKYIAPVNTFCFNHESIYKQDEESLHLFLSLIDDNGNKNIPVGNLDIFFRKATKEEIVNHFDYKGGFLKKVFGEMLAKKERENMYERIHGVPYKHTLDAFEYAIKTKIEMEKEIEGYIVPYDMYGGDLKKGEVFNDLEKEKGSWQLKKGVNIFSFPIEMVERWEKKYKTQEPPIKEKKVVNGRIAPFDLFNGNVKKGDIFRKSLGMVEEYRHKYKETLTVPSEIAETWEKSYESEFFLETSNKVPIKVTKRFIDVGLNLELL